MGATASLEEVLVPQDTPESKHSLSLNTLEHKVLVVDNAGQREVRLTPTEFKLLRYLMENPDRIATKYELVSSIRSVQLAQVLDPELEYGAVNTIIKRIRAKIGDNAHDSRYILTAKGVGYKLIANVLPPARQNGARFTHLENFHWILESRSCIDVVS